MCDGADQNCDGDIDEDFDFDGDGWFDQNDFGCFQTYGILNTDCADNDATAYPGGTEICDGVDNNCDFSVDDGFDEDGDGVWADTAECQAQYGALGCGCCRRSRA